jgi:Amt family ammonium transporter
LKRALGYDDSLDAFGVHCIGGIIGALLTGVFASKEISGSDGSVLTQLWGVGTTLIYGFTVSIILLKIIDKTIGLRVTEEQEREGLDISQHGESIE